MPPRLHRRPLCLLLLFVTPLVGLWFGEGMLPLVSIPGSLALLFLAFGAAYLAPSTKTREKYYVLLAAMVMFVGAWAAGHRLVNQGITECLRRGSELQSALESYRTNHGRYPETLQQLEIKLPGKRHLHPDLLNYQPLSENYHLYFNVDQIRFEATRFTPFAASRREN